MSKNDPWSRPTLRDLLYVIDSIEKVNPLGYHREAERLELTVPAQIITSRGNKIEAITRDMSRNGIGLLHKGCIRLEEVKVFASSEAKNYEYRVEILWCYPAQNGMFMSGGYFLRV